MLQSRILVMLAWAAFFSAGHVQGWPQWRHHWLPGSRHSASPLPDHSSLAANMRPRVEVLQPRPSNRPLDIVLTHYNHANLPQVMDYWRLVLDSIPLKAYIFIYCKGHSTLEDFGWMQHQGELHILPNVGRESHSYLWHITHHIDDLADHTLFNQAMPDMDNSSMIARLRQFSASTGMLGLAMVVDCGCSDCYLGDIPFIKEIWAMSQSDFCSPELRYAAFMKGAFLVSRQRLLDVPNKVYKSLLQVLSAPDDHWAHRQHGYDGLKNENNPLMGHIMERSWNILFDCIDLKAAQQCWACDEGKECLSMACQCRDDMSAISQLN